MIQFYIININRARYKQKLSAGSLNLHITSTGIHGTGSDGGSDWGGTVHLTDNSVTLGATTDNPAYEGTELGGWYTVVSGSSGTMSGSIKNQITIGTTDATKTEQKGNWVGKKLNMRWKKVTLNLETF